MDIKLVSNPFMSVDGIYRTWGVMVDGKFYEFHTESELDCFLQGLGVEL